MFYQSAAPALPRNSASQRLQALLLAAVLSFCSGADVIATARAAEATALGDPVEPDYILTAGDTIDDFLEGFPTVSREQVIEYLKQTETAMEKLAA